jgi:phosphoribosylaminoimidazolecarboxamide formyltransferase / IMP cyclohydrolase
MSSDHVPIKRALISVSDKTGLLDLARALAQRSISLLSTGGTAQALKEAGFAVMDVSDVTGFPEMMEGRVKTLHPKIHGGILARRDHPDHRAAMQQHGIEGIDLVIVNLYPFEKTLAQGADDETTIEMIDIGGPCMIRAAAKNCAHVAVIADPADYAALLAALEETDGGTSLTFRRAMAAKAFARTAAYDAAIAGWFVRDEQAFPERLTIAGDLRQTLRYGENPHQSGAFYVTANPPPGLASALQKQGKELSYNNLNDADAAFELAAEFDRPAIAIIKHANPCGVAEADDLAQAYAAALACDPVSAFGGVIAANRPLDGQVAAALSKLFVEAIIAPGADEEALALLAAKKNVRVLLTGGMPDPAARGMSVRSIGGGYLVQTRDNGRLTPHDVRTVTRRLPTDQEMADLLFAFKVAKHVKSNAIVYARNAATVGIGAGQMSRVDSSRIAALKAADAARAAGLSLSRAQGSVVASDAFFPFADGLIAAAEAGATAIIQPGGSIRDAETIAAADERGLAMVFTGMRHFRH